MVWELEEVAFSPAAMIQLPVGPEVDRAAIVVGGAAQIVEVQEYHLTPGQRRVAAGGEPADTVVDGRGLGRVVDVEVVVRGERGVEGNPQQSTLAVGSTFSVRNGFARSTPALMTRRLPPCWQTNSRPSGANAMAVGWLSDEATAFSVKPAGRFAAKALGAAAATQTQDRILTSDLIPSPIVRPRRLPVSVCVRTDTSLNIGPGGNPRQAPVADFFYSVDWLVFGCPFVYVLG